MAWNSCKQKEDGEARLWSIEKKNFMLLANSFDSSSLFVDKELDSAVESIRPFISVTQKETTTFLQQVFFFFFNCLRTSHWGCKQSTSLAYYTCTLHTYVFLMTYIFTRLISDSVNIRNSSSLVIFPLPFQFSIVWLFTRGENAPSSFLRRLLAIWLLLCVVLLYCFLNSFPLHA